MEERESNLATSRRNRRWLGRLEGYSLVKRHLDQELVSCFVLMAGFVFRQHFPAWVGVYLPFLPRFFSLGTSRVCGSGGLQCTIFEQSSCERDSNAPA